MTTAIARRKLLVLNGQLDKLFGGGTPVLPFTITSINLP